MIVPDVLSRLPLSHFSERDEELLKEVETSIDAVTALVPATDKRLQEIREGLLSDATCSKVNDYCTKGWPRIISADLVPFKRVAASGDSRIKKVEGPLRGQGKSKGATKMSILQGDF